MKNTALFRTDGTWYNIMVDYFHHYKYVICLGVMRKSLPLFYGKESPLKSPPHPFVVLMISVLVSLILNTIILKKKTQVEMRFRARMGNRMAKGQPMLGKYNHPALEHAKPVGCHDSAFFIFQISHFFFISRWCLLFLAAFTCTLWNIILSTSRERNRTGSMRASIPCCLLSSFPMCGTSCVLSSLLCSLPGIQSGGGSSGNG